MGVTAVAFGAVIYAAGVCKHLPHTLAHTATLYVISKLSCKTEQRLKASFFLFFSLYDLKWRTISGSFMLALLLNLAESGIVVFVSN